jgi:hypothetical protein
VEDPYPQREPERAHRCATRRSHRERRANSATCFLRCESYSQGRARRPTMYESASASTAPSSIAWQPPWARFGSIPRAASPRSAIRPRRPPCKRGTVVEARADDRFDRGRLDELGNRVVPVTKAAEEHCLLSVGQPAFVLAGARDRVPEGLASSQPCQAEESAAPPRLRRMDPACEHVVERHDAAPGREPGVTRRLIAEGHGPHPRMNAVGADHHVALQRAPVGERDAHPLRVLVDAGASALSWRTPRSSTPPSQRALTDRLIESRRRQSGASPVVGASE